MSDREKPLILLVDDVAENIDVGKGILTPQYSVSAAINGPLALRIAEQQQPDLILLDVMMPGMNGHEVCRRLKTMEKTQDIPVIFITALDDEGDEVTGLELGAADYVAKPISPAILKARVANQLALAHARRDLDQKNRLLQAEHEFLEELVLRMRRDDQFEQERLLMISRSLDRTCGDVALSATRPNGCHHVLVGDFTGHGLPASIGGILVSYLFYSMTARDCPGEEILEEINQVLFQRMPANLFMAMALAEISADLTRLRLWNAGLPDCLLLKTDGSWQVRQSSLVPLGIVDDLVIPPAADMAFTPGEHCYLFSDGVIEAENGNAEQFGMERLKQALKRHHSGGGLSDIETEFNDFIGGHPLHDDLTLVEISR